MSEDVLPESTIRSLEAALAIVGLQPKMIAGGVLAALEHGHVVVLEEDALPEIPYAFVAWKGSTLRERGTEPARVNFIFGTILPEHYTVLKKTQRAMMLRALYQLARTRTTPEEELRFREETIMPWVKAKGAK